MAGPELAVEAYSSCRSCGARLLVEDHYHVETQTYEEHHEGSGSWGRGAAFELRWVHVPCPHCDEPEPINSLRHTWRQALLTIAFGLLTAALFAAILWLMLR